MLLLGKKKSLLTLVSAGLVFFKLISNFTILCWEQSIMQMVTIFCKCHKYYPCLWCLIWDRIRMFICFLLHLTLWQKEPWTYYIKHLLDYFWEMYLPLNPVKWITMQSTRKWICKEVRVPVFQLKDSWAKTVYSRAEPIKKKLSCLSLRAQAYPNILFLNSL